jgi:hypothetical protein
MGGVLCALMVRVGLLCDEGIELVVPAEGQHAVSKVYM